MAENQQSPPSLEELRAAKAALEKKEAPPSLEQFRAAKAAQSGKKVPEIPPTGDPVKARVPFGQAPPEEAGGAQTLGPMGLMGSALPSTSARGTTSSVSPEQKKAVLELGKGPISLESPEAQAVIAPKPKEAAADGSTPIFVPGTEGFATDSPEQPKPQPQPQPKEPREKQYFTGSIATALNAIDSPGTPYGFLGVGDFIDDAARAIASGYSSGQAGSNSLDVMIDGAAADSQTIQKMIDASARASSLGASDEMNDFTRVYQSEGESFFGLLKGLAYNPGVVPEIIISSFSGLANQRSLQAGGATIAGGAAYGAAAGSAAAGVGAAPGAIGGAVASIPYAFAAASTVLETGSTFAELLQKELGGKEFNVENVRAILQDPEKLSDLRTRAAGRGITIGAIDGLTARLAGSVGAKIIARGGSKAGAVGASSLIEGGGGSAGEAAGRLVAGQKMDIAEIGLEGIAELPMGVIDVGAAAFGSPKYTINGERRTERDVQDIINRATPEELSRMKIEIDNDKKGYGSKIKDLIETGEIKKQVRSANAGIDDVSLGRLVVLEKELVSLSENKTQSAKERTSQIKSEIADIRSRATYAPAPNYSINGISMPAEDFRKAIASMSSKEFVSSKINVENGENEIVDFLANKASVSSKITGVPPSTMEWSGEDVRYKGDRDVLSPVVEFSGEEVRYKGDKDALSPVVEFSGKQVEPKDKDIKPFITYGRGDIVQEAAEPTIRDVINMQGRLFLQRGDVLAGNISMHPEEKGMVVIVDSSGNMYDIGTISEIGDKKIGDIGVEIDDTAGQFRMSEAGIINVRGINYIAPRGLDHIVRSEDGGILEVILPRVSSGGRARKGKKVFTLSDAEEIAYEITLKHIRDNANNAEIEAALAEARQAVQDEGAGRTAGPAAATETKSATGKVRQEVTPTPTADAVQVGTTAQVGAQPVGPEVTGQEGGAGVGPSVQGPTAPQAGGAQGQVTPTTEPTAEGPVRPEAPAAPSIQEVDAEPAKYGYHGGTLSEKSDYLRTGYRGEQPFTGYYFTSNRGAAEQRGDRFGPKDNKQARAVDFSKYNLLRPTTNGYWAIKSGLKKIEDAARNNNAEAVASTISQIAAFDTNLGSQLSDNKDNILDWYKEWDAQKEANFETRDYAKSATERFETFVLKKLGYEGIDVRGLKDQNGEKSPDTEAEGSVIFDIKPGTAVDITPGAGSAIPPPTPAPAAAPAPTIAPTPNKETVAKMKDLDKVEEKMSSGAKKLNVPAKKAFDEMVASDPRLEQVKRVNFEKAVTDLEKSGKLKVRCP